jgi:hypothetical protein
MSGPALAIAETDAAFGNLPDILDGGVGVCMAHAIRP